MLNIIGLVGTNAPHSYNRMLLQYMKQYFSDQLSITVEEIEEIPLFNEQNMNQVPQKVSELSKKIDVADGVIIATPEYDHAVPAALKSTLEWLSVVDHPLTEKPVMIIGTSLGIQGTARAQDNLRQILNSPGIDAFVLPGDEFLMNFAQNKFDENGNLSDSKTIAFLMDRVTRFKQFVSDYKSMFVAVDSKNN